MTDQKKKSPSLLLTFSNTNTNTMLFQSAFRIKDSAIHKAKAKAKAKAKSRQLSNARLVMQGNIPKIKLH